MSAVPRPQAEEGWGASNPWAAGRETVRGGPAGSGRGLCKGQDSTTWFVGGKGRRRRLENGGSEESVVGRVVERGRWVDADSESWGG